MSSERRRVPPETLGDRVCRMPGCKNKVRVGRTFGDGLFCDEHYYEIERRTAAYIEARLRAAHQEEEE